MSDADEEIYQEIILDHSRSPRNKGALEKYTHYGIAKHQLKGDEMKVYLQCEGDKIEKISFEGEGSAVAVASASIMTETAKGKAFSEIESLYNYVVSLLSEEQEDLELSDLAAISGVRKYPNRIDCALLAWNALKSVKAC